VRRIKIASLLLIVAVQIFLLWSWHATSKKALRPIYLPPKPFRYIGPLSGISIPCVVGEVAFIIDAPSGQNIFLCVKPKTWEQQSPADSHPKGTESQ
jgi:hypothetical protein